MRHHGHAGTPVAPSLVACVAFLCSLSSTSITSRLPAGGGDYPATSACPTGTALASSLVTARSSSAAKTWRSAVASGEHAAQSCVASAAVPASAAAETVARGCRRRRSPSCMASRTSIERVRPAPPPPPVDAGGGRRNLAAAAAAAAAGGGRERRRKLRQEDGSYYVRKT